MSPPDSLRPPAHSGNLDALCLLARLHHVAADPASLAHRLSLAPGDAVSPEVLLRQHSSWACRRGG